MAASADFVAYLNAAITSFHSVAEVKRRLVDGGFVELDERRAWSVQPGGRYFFSRNGSALCAFAVGGGFEAGSGGAILIGAHTDSPCLKLKPVSRLDKEGHVMLGVVGYGGGLWHTWFDRDLSVAGRVLVRSSGGKLVPRLVRIPKPIARISNLAIHLTSADERSKGFLPNLQTQAPPMLASAIRETLWRETRAAEAAGGRAGDASDHASEKPSDEAAESRHHPLLVSLIARELQVEPTDIVDFELQLIDTQEATLGGVFDEFVYSGRLDNQCSCYMAVAALLGSLDSLASDSCIRMVALFDHEEVGSMSATGAEGPLLTDALARLNAALGNGATDPTAASLRSRSLHLSADMAHAIHPNYADRHDKSHSPQLGGGLVIKHNADQRYATDGPGAAMVRRFAVIAGKKVQTFAVRGDSRCGTTIGPIIGSGTGIRSVDVGAPQLSMHSCREVMAAEDVSHGIAVFKAAFEHYGQLSAAVDLDTDEPMCAECAPGVGWTA